MTLFLALLDRLTDAADDVADDMAQAIRQDFAHYRDFASHDHERTWRAGLRGTLALFVDTARTGRALTSDERRRIALIGETRVDQGVPLDVVLGSVRLAMHVVLSAVRHQADDLRDFFGFENAFDDMSLCMTRFINAFSTEVSRGYIARSEKRATSLERDRAQFGSDLLAGVFTAYQDASTTGAALGIDIPQTIGLVLVATSGPSHAPLVADLGRTVPSALVVPIGTTPPHTALVVPAPATCDWADAAKRVAEVAERHHVTALLVEPCEGPRDWCSRYAEAAASIGLVSAFADGRTVIDARELVPAQFVAAGPPVALQAIEREVLSPLRRHPRKAKKLLRALDALMRTDGSPKAAARLLGVAVTTARTYKTTIEQQTRLYFDCPADAMRLGFAWLVLRHFDGRELSG